MSTIPPHSDPVSRVRVTRTFEASRQRVYRAWTDPELMMKWFAEPDYDMRILELDLRVGGRYRFEGEVKGKRWSLGGTYLEVRPPERLVYTWKWEDDPALGGPGDTIVTVDFFERGAGTEIVVTQEGFSNALARREHQAGWIGCLDRLGRLPLLTERSPA
jgi:uncharacterized protein YndB with AHSA1/START domain